MSTMIRPGVFTRPLSVAVKGTIILVVYAFLVVAAAVLLYVDGPVCIERSTVTTLPQFLGPVPFCD